MGSGVTEPSSGRLRLRYQSTETSSIVLYFIFFIALHYILFQFNDRNISSLKTSEWILYTLRTKFVFWDFFLLLPESKSISKFGSGFSSKMLGSGLAMGAIGVERKEKWFLWTQNFTTCYYFLKNVDCFSVQIYKYFRDGSWRNKWSIILRNTRSCNMPTWRMLLQQISIQASLSNYGC